MLASFLLQIIGLFALAMTMHKHGKLVFRKNTLGKLSGYLKVIGWSALILSLVLPVIWEQTPSIAMVSWFANLSLGIVLIAAFLCFMSAKKTPKNATD